MNRPPRLPRPRIEPSLRRLFSAVALALVALGPAAPAPAAAAQRLIAGVLPDRGDTIERWGWSGAWVYPVGDPRSFARPDPSGAPGYKVLRSVLRDRRGVVLHQGADLGNGRSGGAVRAAANGLVVRAADDDPGGYGNTVVLAHRLEDGGLAYSVYAHLLAGSNTVHEGEMVAAGQALARVGRTGRASTDHLHSRSAGRSIPGPAGSAHRSRIRSSSSRTDSRPVTTPRGRSPIWPGPASRR